MIIIVPTYISPMYTVKQRNVSNGKFFSGVLLLWLLPQANAIRKCLFLSRWNCDNMVSEKFENVNKTPNVIHSVKPVSVLCKDSWTMFDWQPWRGELKPRLAPQPIIRNLAWTHASEHLWPLRRVSLPCAVSVAS